MWTRPNLREAHVFVGNIVSLEVAGWASYLDGIVLQIIKPRGGLSTNGMTVYVEVVRTGGGIPECEITANLGGVLGDKIGDGCLGVDTRVIPQKVDGKGQEKEMGFLWMARSEGTSKKSHLKHVFAEVIS
jgi:hypothetical protein